MAHHLQHSEALSEEAQQQLAALGTGGGGGGGGEEVVRQVAQAALAELLGRPVPEVAALRPAAARRAQGALQGFLRGCVRRGLDGEQAAADLRLLGWPDSSANLLVTLYIEALPALKQAAMDATLTVNRLEDIDWRFGVVAASRSMDKVGNTFLQMKIHRTDQPTANIELSLEQFYAFLSEMEKAEATLKSF